MKHKHLLVILTVQLHLIAANQLLLQNESLTETFDITNFIEYPYDQRCLQIVLDKQQPYLIAATHKSIYVRSRDSLKFRDITTEIEGQCETFLIFAENIEMIREIIQFNPTVVKQFFPFTKIYFHLDNREITNGEDLMAVRQFLIMNAAFGYMFEYMDNDPNVIVRDLLSSDSDVKYQQLSHIPRALSHPLVDTNLVKDGRNDFRISLFNCTPYTIYPQLDSADYNAFVNAMDGTEFRLVKEVTKNWKKKFEFRDFSKVKRSPYAAILDDLANKSSDMSMCALWIREDIHKRFDFSTFYMHQCLTLIVPKPRKLNEASAIYTTLDTHVWLLFLFAFLLSIVLLNSIAKAERHLNNSDSVFTDLTVTALEVVNSATSHSVSHFPNDQISVKIVLISWIFVSTLMGIGYTTIYASRLASPSYEKPINTVRDVLDNGLYICNAYLDESTATPMRKSINADYRAMAQRLMIYGDNAQYRRRVFRDRKCAVFEVRSTKNYVPLHKFADDFDLLRIFRPMKYCVFNFYTGFAFPKYSPFTKLFNWHIRQYQESGITQKWNTEILQNSKEMQILFNDYPKLYKRKIKMVNISGAFFLLGTGLSISLVAFFIELLKHRREIAINSLKSLAF